MGQDSIYRFGPFEVDAGARQLRRNRVRLKLYGQSLQILLMLLERPGQVVTREEMRRAIWPEGTFVDFEHGLNAAIKNLRRTLSDSVEKPAFVETVPRVGYRFCGRVERVVGESAAAESRAEIKAEAEPGPRAEFQPQAEPQPQALVSETVEPVAVSVPAARAFGWGRWWSAVAAVVVLCAVAGVVGWRWLRPRARVEVAAARSPQNLEGDDLYLHGRYFWNKRTGEGFGLAAEYFQQAIAKDPKDARAYVGLADTYAMMCSWNMLPHNEYMPRARAAATRALELDDKLPEAHASLALILENYDWNWTAAEREYRQAIELNPRYAPAHQWYAEFLTWQGRFDEAARESARAHELDPLSLIIAADRGAMLYYARQYRESIAQFERVGRLDPHFPRNNFVVYSYVKSGEYGPALAKMKEQRQLYGDMDWVISMQAYLDASSGRSEQARQGLERLRTLSRRQAVDPQFFFWPYMGLGEREKALEYLEQAVDQHSNIITSLKVEPAFDPLRGDARFQALLRRAGLG